MGMRAGLGYDSHTFGAERPLVLAGVTIPYPAGLAGHSDGDAIAHAVIDALLGAAALGDIGQRFPNTDPRYQDADSMKLLAEVVGELAAHGFAANNVDVTVIAEAPKLAPHVEMMRGRLAAGLGLEVGRVSIKAKTNEGMDAVGRGEGIQVFAVATVEETA